MKTNILKEQIKKYIISELLSFDTFLGDLYSQIIEIDPRAEIVEDNNEKVIKIGDNIIIQVTTEFDSNKEAKYVIYEYDKKDPNVVKNKFLSSAEVVKFVQDNFKNIKPKELMENNNTISLYEVYEDLRKSGKFDEDYGNHKTSTNNTTWNQLTIKQLFDNPKVNKVTLYLNNDRPKEFQEVELKREDLKYCEPRFIDFPSNIYIFQRIKYADIKNVK